MRKALNENPVVQVTVIGVMAILVAFLLFTRVLGGDDEPPPDPAATATEDSAASAAPDAAATPPAADPAASAATPAPGAAPSEPVPPPAGAPVTPANPDVAAAFVPGPGLPERVVVAYARNRAVVLLIEKRKGFDDQALRAGAAALRDRGDVELIEVPATDIAKYARITSGVDVSRVPALVVLRPRKLTDNVPEATVSYGFRSPESIVQAVRDALYDGKSITYDP